MPKMSQVLGIERATRIRVHRGVSDLFLQLKRPDLFSGLNRTYTPLDELGERLPAETKRVQNRVVDVLLDLRRLQAEWFDAVATKEWGNTQARADIKVGEEVVLADVPVGFLLFLQKRLDDLLDFLRNVPTLDPSEEWEQDRANGHYRSDTVITYKMKKVPRSHVLVEATEHHPAQAETYFEDVSVGEWRRTLLSGALPAPQVEDLIRRTTQLRDAVIVAREQANSATVDDRRVASEILKYIFG